MKIISRAEAKALGLTHYYTGKPCRNGHIEKRQTQNGTCKECQHTADQRLAGRHPLRSTYFGMRQRCYYEEHAGYSDYGGRGITVCDRWLDPVDGYDNFVVDMGPRPEGFSIDRIDYDGNYEPSNCRWADRVTQGRNKRNTRLNGEDVLEVYKRRDAGWTIKKIASHFDCYTSTVCYALQNREKYIEQGLGRCTKTAA
jgi:hypothetical protein